MIDPQPAVRLLVRRILEPAVGSVLEAGTGAAGARVLQHPLFPRIDLVVTELDLPGSTGAEAVRTLREHRPGLPIVCLSARTEPEVAAELADLNVPVVAKPLREADLLTAVQAALAVRPSEDVTGPTPRRPQPLLDDIASPVRARRPGGGGSDTLI